MKLESIPQIIDFNPFEGRTEAESTHARGELVVIADGRSFRYASAGAALTRGLFQLSPAQKTNHHNNTAIASTAPTVTPTMTIGATALVADEYNEGFVTVNVTPDVGRTYKIQVQPAVASAGTGNPTLYEPIVTSWTTATRASYVHNAWNGTVEGTVTTRRGAGTAMSSPAASGDFYWVQSRGVSATLAQGNNTLGAPLGVGSVAGSLTDITDELGASAFRRHAYCDIMAGVDAEYRPVTLAVD